jgi:phosphatidylglycerol---prolipoprotein diacylglyceryl transferase
MNPFSEPMQPSVAEIFWVVAVLVSIGFVILVVPPRKLDCRIAYWAGITGLAGGLLGGSILCLFDYGVEDRTLNLFSRGKSFCGGLAGGAVAAAIFLAWRKVSVARYGDVLVTALPLGYAIGRVGCFFNGCDYGIVTQLPWAVRYPPGTEPYAAHLERGRITSDQVLSLSVHPVQLYAAAFGLALFLVLWNCRVARHGQRIWLFCLCYGVYRFLIEWLRGDFRAIAGGLSLPQIFSLLLIAGALGFWVWKVKTYRHAGRMRTNAGNEQTQPI